MTQAEYNNHLITLQCKYSSWADKLDKSLKFGVCAKKHQEHNIDIAFMLPAMMNYIMLETEVTSAFRVCFYSSLAGAETVSITVGGHTENYTSATFDVATVVDDFNAVTGTTDYIAVLSPMLGCVIFYSTDPAKSFDEVDEPIIVTNGRTFYAETTSLEGSFEIEDALNCLTFEDICSLKGRIEFLLTNVKCK